jgi:HAD superfamily hydrolase (TIGR01490 family)
VALFDVDRTLVDVHTGELFVRFQRELGELRTVDLLRKKYFLFQYAIGRMNAEQVARFLGEEYCGQSASLLRERCRGWFDTYVRKWVSRVGRERVRQHKDRGHVVAIVTSTLRQMAQPLADDLGIEHLICSDLNEQDDAFTGSFQLPLSYGAGKVVRARVLLESLGATLDDAIYYSDSITDLPLLEAVKRPIAINPDWRLRNVARRRGWPIENWTNAVNDAVPLPKLAELTITQRLSLPGPPDR